jgi:3-oxoadipate enol-lactonase
MKVIANGIAQFYERRGAGPPLVLIHALGVDHRMWEAQSRQLDDVCTVYSYDVRGHGLTDVPAGPYTLLDFAEDLAGLLDALGVAEAHLVGLSMGGIIAQQFAISWPDRVRSLVLADTASEYNQEARRQLAERARIVDERGMAPVVESIIGRWFTEEFQRTNPDSVNQIRISLIATMPMGYASSCRAVGSVDLTEGLVSIRVPTLVLVGSEDRSTPPETALRIHEYIPGSSYEVIPGAAHLSNVSNPREFNDGVIRTVRLGELAAGRE